MGNNKLSSLETKSLKAIIQQYETYKTAWDNAMQEAEDAAEQLDQLEDTIQKLNTEIDFQK